MPADVGAVEAPVKTVAEQLDAIFAPWNRTDEPGMVVGVVKDGALDLPARLRHGEPGERRGQHARDADADRLDQQALHLPPGAAAGRRGQARHRRADPHLHPRAERPRRRADPAPADAAPRRLALLPRPQLHRPRHGGAAGRPRAEGAGAPERAQLRAGRGDDLQQRRLPPGLDRHRAGRRRAVRGPAEGAALRRGRHAGHRLDPHRPRRSRLASRRCTCRIRMGRGGAASSPPTSCAARARSSRRSTTCCAGRRTCAPATASARPPAGRR